ncbi:hypothetical protein GN958_ATG16562 [Phytophthora infestans]|uniref:Uncharacterized protein n=1 Tax=Phytophthora infestans TaxID=4787 RepID=A0A8S9U3P1_PHYIN|nr:hypothetical protein GN958_ATG16562 [Phytophthora infestans]
MKLVPSLDGNLLATPKFKDWLTYVNDFNRKYPRAAKSAASAFTSHYGDDLSGNRRFSLMLNAAVGNENTNALALQLQTERWRDWTHKNISPPKVFDFLLLNSDDALKNPLFTFWLKYLDEFNARNPDYRMTLTGALSIGLGSNEKLAEVLETGLSAHGTKAISTTLKNRVFAEWEAKEFTPDFVFENVLRLKKGYWDPNVPGLSDPILKFWLRYTHEFNHRHPRDSTTLLDTLRNNFADASIVTMLVDSKTNPATEASAQGLESLLFTKWLDENLSPRDITRLVYADKSDEMLNKYTRLFQMKKPNVP